MPTYLKLANIPASLPYRQSSAHRNGYTHITCTYNTQTRQRCSHYKSKMLNNIITLITSPDLIYVHGVDQIMKTNWPTIKIIFTGKQNF